MSETPRAFDALLSRAEAAAFLGIAPKTLANLATKGDGPPFFYIGPRSVRYLQADLHEWREARKVRNTTEGDAKGLSVRGSRLLAS